MKKRLFSILLSLAMVVTMMPAMTMTAFATGTTYAITNDTPESAKETNHGYIAIDKATAAEGETVTITVNPAEGYQLKSLTATHVAPTEYNVTFDLNGITGTAPEAQTIKDGDKVTKPADPTDTVHTFAGWYKTKNATTGALSDPWNFDNGTVTADMTLYAQWTKPMKDLLGNDFPKSTGQTVSSPENAWKNGNGYTAYIYSSDKYFKLDPGNGNGLACLTSNKFTRISDDKYVFEYVNGSTSCGVFTLNIEDSTLVSIEYNGAGTSYAELSGTYSPVSQCIATGTMISMPEGRQKAVEELEIGDVICTFDHETGEVSSAPVCFIWESKNAGNAFTLTFEDDVEVTVIEEHGFYDQEEQKYVFINLQNAEEYIGDHFYNAVTNSWLALKNCEALNESIDAYAIITSGDLNHMSNGMLSMCDGSVKVLANIFEYDNQMKFDADKKKADIEAYGLTPKEKILELEGFIESDYDDYNLQYLNVAIGKGLTTWEWIEAFSDYCVENGLVDIYSGSETAEKNEAPKMLLMSATAPKTLLGSTPEPTPQDGIEIKANENGTYTFSMPGYPVTVTAEFEEKAITIADILTDDFPTFSWPLPDNVWKNSVGSKMYINNNGLTFGGVSLYNILSKPVTKDGNNYKYISNPYTITFVMDSDKLVKVITEGAENADNNGEYILSHTHTFTYTANNGKITATCTAGCDKGYDTTPLTLTLTAPTSLVYDGNAKAFTFADGEADAWTGAGLELPTITYTVKTGSELTDGEAVEAGSYTASVTVNEESASIDFTINKADMAVGTNITAPSVPYSTLVFNGQPQQLLNSGLTYDEKDGSEFGTFYYSVDGTTWSTALPTAIAADEYNPLWYFVGGSNHNNIGSQEEPIRQLYPVEITASDQIIATVDMSDYKYNTTPSVPSLSEELEENPTVTYFYNTTDSTTGGTEWKDITGTSLNAGDYYIYAVIAATDNYNEYTTKTTVFTVAKAEQDAPAEGEGYNVDYSHETLTPTDSYEVSTGSGDSFNTGKLSGGTYIAFATDYYVRKAEDTNHKASNEVKFSFTRPAAPSGFTIAEESVQNKKDGSIGGITQAMEYKKNNGEWTTGPAEITGLSNETIRVRIKATTSSFLSEEYSHTFTASSSKLTVTMGDIQSEVAYGEKVIKPDDPSKNEYTFGGWYKDQECTQAWNFGADIVTDNIILYAKWIKEEITKAAISGNVTEKNKGVVPGATVELLLGIDKIAATVTNSEGNYTFDNVENGIYNIVVTKDGKTKTELVPVNETGNFTKDVVLPTGNVNSLIEYAGEEIPEAKSDISQAVVGGLDLIAEGESPSGDQKITIKLKVEPKADDNTEAQQEIRGKAGEGKKVEFIDMSLLRVNNGEETPIGDENTTLLTIVIPFDFSTTYVNSVMVLRKHGNGNAEKLTTTANNDGEYYEANEQAGTITIYAKKFSDYAIAYEEKAEYVAKIGNTNYATLEDAIKHVRNRQTIKLTADVGNENIAIARRVLFSIDNDGHTNKATIKADKRFHLYKKGNTYFCISKAEEAAIIAAVGTATVITVDIIADQFKEDELNNARQAAMDAIYEAALDCEDPTVKALFDEGYEAVAVAKTKKEINKISEEFVARIGEAKALYEAKLLVLETKIYQNKLTAKKNGKIKVSFENPYLDGTVNYQVVRSTKKDFSTSKKTYTVKAKAQKTLTYTNGKSLKKGTRYYYKVRAKVELSDGTTLYTDWSNVRYTKCKKTVK